MPTISQLAPVTASADADELPVSQNGVTRKVTRAQIIAGLQQEIVTKAGTLLGRGAPTSGGPEEVQVGTNLILSNGTLSATGADISIQGMNPGTVPSGSDLVPVSQDGKTVAVQYRQLLSGLPGVPNVDVSNTVISIPGDPTTLSLSEAVGSRISLSGGTVTGLLSLAQDPTLARHAAPKAYVDTSVSARLARTGGTMTGALTLSVAPTLAAHAATKGYVDSVVTGGAGGGSIIGGTLLGSLTLVGDPTGVLEAAPKQYVDRRVQRSGDTLTGQLSLVGDPTSNEHAANKSYVDSRVASALPRSGGSISGSLILSADPTLALHPATKQYADGRVLRTGDTMTGVLTLAGDPTVGAHATTKSYVDDRDSLAVAKSGATMTGMLTLAGDPIQLAHASTKRYVDQQVGLMLPLAGGTVSGALSVATAPVLATQVANKSYVDTAVAKSMSATGGTITGALTLTVTPTAPQHVATKEYVDANPGSARVINVALPPYNAKLDGVTDDTAAFKAAYQNAPTNGVIYVPQGTTVLQSPDTWGIALTKRVKWIVNGTTTSTGVALGSCIPGGAVPAAISLPGLVVGHSPNSITVSKNRSQTTDLAAFQSACIVNHDGGTSAVITNARTDTIIYASPGDFVWNGLDRLVWAGRGTPSASQPAQHVARYVQTVRQGVYTAADGTIPPQPELWAACLEFRDVSGKSSSQTGASLTVEMDWFGNGPDDAKNRQIQSLVVGQHDLSGAPVDVSTVIGVYLAAGSKGQVQRVLHVGTPFSYAVLDTTYATQLPGANAIKMAAGHSIAFEPSGNTRLAFDSATNCLRWYQGVLSYVVGKGISVGWQNVVTANTTLAGYLAGNLVFLAGSGVYTVTLPPAGSVPAGSGFTFSAAGSGTPTIVPSGGESLELGPVTLRQHDRYHVVSDGTSAWREIFRTNAVSPRFTAPPVLPSYPVAGLPSSVQAGAKAFATNGRKPSELSGAGTGVEVFFDGVRWISVCSGTQVTA